MSEIQQYSSSGATPVVATRRKSDAAAAPIAYVEDSFDDPTWQAVAREVVQAAENSCGRSIDAVWGSFAAPQSVKRSRSDGSYYRQQLAWCVGPTGVTLVEARQGGEMAGKQFRPSGPWRVTADYRATGDASVKVLHKRAPAPPLPGLPGSTQSAGSEMRRDPLSANYGGAHGEVWANLPLRAREAVEFAAPFGADVRSEYSTGRLEWNRRLARERIWFERRSTTTLAGVYAARERNDCDPTNLREAGRALSGRDWHIVAVRADHAANSAGKLDGGTKRALGER